MKLRFWYPIVLISITGALAQEGLPTPKYPIPKVLGADTIMTGGWDERFPGEGSLKVWRQAKMLEMYGLAAYSQGDYGYGIEVFKKALRLYPHDAEFWHNLAKCYKEKGNTKATEQALLSGVKADPLYFGCWAGLADLYVKQHRYEEARSATLRAIKSKGTEEQREKGKKLLNQIEGLIAKSKQTPAAPASSRQWEQKADELARAGRYAEAKQTLRRAENKAANLSDLLRLKDKESKMGSPSQR